MKLETMVKWSFMISLAVTLIGAYLKITHSVGAETVLTIGVISTLIFIASAIYEKRLSNRINHAEKTMWTIAFLFMSAIAGIIYFVTGRKRIVQ